MNIKYYLCIRFSRNRQFMEENKEVCAPLWELNAIWDTLSEAQKEWVSEQVEVVRYNKNDIIHLEGDEAKYVWTLVSGKVRIYKEGIGQRQQIIRLLKPYDLFGFRAVIAGDTYNSCANAFEACVVCRLSSDCFNQLVRENGEFCYQIMLMMARDLAISEIRTLNLTQKHIRGRLAEALITLIDQYGYESDGETIAMLLPREDLANMSNMTTSNAIRTLSQLAQEGLIDINGRHIRILNAEELKRVSRLG